MDVRTLRSWFNLPLGEAGLVRTGTRWVRPSAELIWVVEVRRERQGQTFAMDLGILPRCMEPGRETPTVDQCLVWPNWSALGRETPPEPVDSRFVDRVSFLAMHLDFGHDLVGEGDRLDAIAWIARDIGVQVDRIATLSDLRDELADEERSKGWLVRRDVRTMLAP